MNLTGPQSSVQVDRFQGVRSSTDPHFEKKLVDVVGLCLDPPERAMVFSFDGETQVQALDRTQPSLPMTKGRAGTTHGYQRNGTTDLFAAMDVVTAEVLYDSRRRHGAAEVLSFFNVFCCPKIEVVSSGSKNREERSAIAGRVCLVLPA